VEEHGMSVSTNKGAEQRVPQPVYHDDLALLTPGAPWACVFVTLKSVNTLEAVAALRQLPPGTIIVSLQNGVGNAALLREECPQARVFAGMFPFNVVQLPPTHFHQATVAPIFLEDAAATHALVAALTAAEVPTVASANMTGVLHGKLLLNLNNAINALSGLPLRQELGTYVHAPPTPLHSHTYTHTHTCTYASAYERAHPWSRM
jgi:2-dehydropantoate 2-reductase